MPKLPWRTVHIDFYGPLPSSEYLLVAVDRYYRFPEVEIVHSTRASTVIPKLDKMFSVHGIPDTIISDNGPPFNGDEYARYLKALGIQAKFSTPYWPQEARDNEKTRQELNREYANQRRNTRKSDLQVGDYVLVRQEKKNKLTANFNHKPYKVIKKTGSEILAQSKDGHIVKRNVSHFKRIINHEKKTLMMKVSIMKKTRRTISHPSVMKTTKYQEDQAEFEYHRIDTDMNIHQI
ncbi:Retrovirus-related Pol poly [Paramuricea clavata]|uniref:Retrovirus-related Pol poly n=1 Tax=Paramuricea clavata TaxID=317549 RepID=A0A6S7J7Y5_PARCT|nr:Retrovirus-related Pol poly [Paramuricea clavata]